MGSLAPPGTPPQPSRGSGWESGTLVPGVPQGGARCTTHVRMCCRLGLGLGDAGESPPLQLPDGGLPLFLSPPCRKQHAAHPGGHASLCHPSHPQRQRLQPGPHAEHGAAGLRGALHQRGPPLPRYLCPPRPSGPSFLPLPPGVPTFCSHFPESPVLA